MKKLMENWRRYTAQINEGDEIKKGHASNVAAQGAADAAHEKFKKQPGVTTQTTGFSTFSEKGRSDFDAMKNKMFGSGAPTGQPPSAGAGMPAPSSAPMNSGDIMAKMRARKGLKEQEAGGNVEAEGEPAETAGRAKSPPGGPAAIKAPESGSPAVQAAHAEAEAMEALTSLIQEEILREIVEVVLTNEEATELFGDQIEEKLGFGEGKPAEDEWSKKRVYKFEEGNDAITRARAAAGMSAKPKTSGTFSQTSTVGGKTTVQSTDPGATAGSVNKQVDDFLSDARGKTPPAPAAPKTPTTTTPPVAAPKKSHKATADDMFDELNEEEDRATMLKRLAQQQVDAGATMSSSTTVNGKTVARSTDPKATTSSIKQQGDDMMNRARGNTTKTPPSTTTTPPVAAPKKSHKAAADDMFGSLNMGGKK